MPTPAILQSPAADIGLKRGFDTLARLLAVTLGPTQGNVLCPSPLNGALELLTDSAAIARRVLALPDRSEDVGAMLLRNLVWRMHLRVGDGCATTAVLAQAILQEAFRYKAAGANPMLLHRGLKRAAQAAITALAEMARPVEDEEDLLGVAQTITGEPGLSLILSELFDLLGPAAYINIQDYVAPYLEREYHDGGRWVGRVASPYFISQAATHRALLADCRVALFAGAVTEVAQIQPLLELVARAESRKKLVLVAHEIKGPALATLVANHQQRKLPNFAVELRRPPASRHTDLLDLAVVSGATLLSPETGRTLESIKADELGLLQRAEADTEVAVFVADPASSTAVHRHIETLSAQLAALPELDEQRDALRLRIARLSGQVATLKIGAFTKAAREALHQQATKAVRALPYAQREGVVPGGGLAYLNCIPAVTSLAAEGEEAWGIAILARALEAPFRQLVTNVGVDSPPAILAEMRRRGPQFGYDAISQAVVDLAEAGILDSAGVLRQALETAVSGAAMALTTETVVLKRKPKESLEP